MLNWQHSFPSPLLPTSRQVGRKEVVAHKQHQKKPNQAGFGLKKVERLDGKKTQLQQAEQHEEGFNLSTESNFNLR